MPAPGRVVWSRCLDAEVWMAGAESDGRVDALADREPIGGPPMAQDRVHLLANERPVAVESDKVAHVSFLVASSRA